jgi:hypothetical protein
LQDGYLQDIIFVRLLVGLLGEQDHAGWWKSNFLSPTSDAFLRPIFPKSSFVAKYHGVLEAACRVHDERVGVGRVFHLFRLPENIEQRCFAKLSDNWIPDNFESATDSEASTLSALNTISAGDVPYNEGPIRLGEVSQFNKPAWLSNVASHYSAAFGANGLCIPYFTDQK